MRWKDVNLKPDSHLLRQFGAIAAIVCAGIALRQLVVLNQQLPAAILGTVSIIFGALAYLRPEWLRILFVASIVVTFPIGWIVSHVILLILFFGLMTPMAITFRWMGRDILNLKPASDPDSTFWVPKEVNADKRSYFRQF